MRSFLDKIIDQLGIAVCSIAFSFIALFHLKLEGDYIAIISLKDGVYHVGYQIDSDGSYEITQIVFDLIKSERQKRSWNYLKLPTIPGLADIKQASSHRDFRNKIKSILNNKAFW